MANRKYNIKELIWAFVIFGIVFTCIFIASLFQFVAAEPFSMERTFSTNNIKFASIAMIASIAITIAVEVIRQNK